MDLRSTYTVVPRESEGQKRNVSCHSNRPLVLVVDYDPELQAAKLPMAHGRDAVEVADGAAEDGGSVLPGKEPVEVGLDGLTVAIRRMWMSFSRTRSLRRMSPR